MFKIFNILKCCYNNDMGTTVYTVMGKDMKY